MPQKLFLVLFAFLLRAQAANSQEDMSSRDNPQSYAALASSLEKFPERLPDLRAVLDRGLKVAVRDGDLAGAAWFGSALRSAGGGEAISLLGPPLGKPRSTVVVPGGMKALMFAARGREPGPPERFFAEYSRTVVAQYKTLGAGPNEVVDRIQDHFKRIRALEALGTRSGAQVSFSLSAHDPQSRAYATRVLGLLGWRLETRAKRISVSADENGASSGHQVTATALDIDELGMQSALQSGEDFQFTVTDDSVPVLLDEHTWLEQLRYSACIGGFADALARELQFAKAYAGLSELDDDSLAALTRGVGVNDLLRRYADDLYYFSSALAVAGGRVVLPGGDAAAGAWTDLVKASPLKPAEFFGALLRADEGRLLAYFFTLSQLDWQHQQFFTHSPSRTARFYDLFRNSIGIRNGINRGLRECPFADFLSEVPLDRNGRVVFPGGPGLWLVAKGYGSVAATARMMTRVSEVVSPDVEDDILIRLARTRYETNYAECSELDNFLAVARIDSHRQQPMDSKSALLLAQQYSRYRTVWPYFSIFTGLGYEEYSQFFALGERLAGYSGVRENDYLGHFGSLLELLSLVHQSRRLDQAQVTELFRLLCTRLSSAERAGDFACASLEITRELLKAASGIAPVEDPDAVMLDLLTGGRTPFRLAWKGNTYDIDSTAARRLRYQQVMRLQKVTPLGPLFRICDSLRELETRKLGREESVSRIEKAVTELPYVEIPNSLELAREVRQNLESSDPRDLVRLAARLRRAAAGGGDLADVRSRFIEALSPQVRLALSGIVYAYYLDPDDLLISEDPLFVRKHQFVSLRTRTKPATVFAEHTLAREQGSGSNLVGSFAGFGLMAGKVAVVAVQQNAGGAEFFAAAQLGTLRITRWEDSNDGDTRLASLKIRTAREWAVESALSADARSALFHATLGLLSLNRRSHLFRSLEARDWGGVWRSVTLSDLYQLGDEFLTRYPDEPWPSPTLGALRREAARRKTHPDWLGQDLQEVMACSHSHLLRLPPYERYERSLLPGKLAERTSEFKLYLAQFMDGAGIPSGAFETLSEPLARELFRDLVLTDRRDWRGVLDSFSRLDESMIERVIAKTWSGIRK